jgi:anthranilate 1,2-dioxygenase (deaminating, decarboxylating) small subunit
MPRTLHLISNVRIGELENGELEVRLNWHTLFYRLATSEQFYGRATYRLKPHADSWLISRKHVLLLNDTINSVLDFYHL